MLAYVIAVDHHLRTRHIRRVKRNISQNLFHDGVKTAGADVLVVGIDFLGESGNFLKAVISKAQAHILRVQKSGILLCQGIVGFLEDAEEFISLGADRLGTSRIVKLAKAERGSGDGQAKADTDSY